MKRLHVIRNVVRVLAGACFWLRPLVGLLHLHLPSSWQAHYVSLSPTAFLLCFITYYVLLSESGWLSVAYDLAYVYFWPLFVVWLIVKYGTIRAFKALRSNAPATAKSEILVSEVVPDSPARSIESRSLSVATAVGKATRPFFQFFMLWALLLLNTTSPFLTGIALVVVAIGAIRIVRNLSLFLSDAGSWIATLKGRFASQVADNISKVRNFENESDPKPSRDAANVLHIYEVTFRYMAENKTRLARWTLIASILITVPFYLYLSFIFTSIYLGVARLEHISWAWTDALTTSIFIPFAFTDLPHNLWIRIIGGCQALSVTLLGYTVLFQRMHRSMQQLSDVATELHVPFGDEALKQKIIPINAIPKEQTALKPKKRPRRSTSARKPA